MTENLDEKSYLIIYSDENVIKIEKGPFCELIGIIIDDYKDYPNYSYLFNIDSIYRYLKSEFNNNENKEKILKQNIIIENYNVNDYDYIKYRNSFQEVKLFGEKFVKYNKNNAFIINEKGKKIELTEKYDFKSNSDEISIKLIIIKEEIDMNYMFYNCINLLSVDNISNWKKTKIFSLSHLFYNCNSLKLLPDISNWDISRIDNFKLMFCNCYSLSPFPHLDKWMYNNEFKNEEIFGLSYNNLQKISFNGFRLDKHNLNEENTLNKMTIYYKSQNWINGKMRLFGEEFVKKIGIIV